MKITWKKTLTFLCTATLFALAAPDTGHAQGFPGFGGGRGGGGGGRGGTTTSQRTYAGNGEIGEAVIMADPETRRIIVITDDETATHISQVVTNLDQPKPQVLIKVLFVEIRYTDDFDLGATITQANAELSNSSLRTSLSTDTALAAAGALITGGAAPSTLNFISGDVNATLRAISAKANTEVLSRPSILTRNNQEAVITVGQEVPFVTNSRIDNTTGDTINTVQYEDVGIILRVTPFITQDGLVEMIVAPEISAVSGTTVTVSPGVTLNVIDKRAAETVVVTSHATTVVIGGLMETKKDEVIRKIPVLGDIPLLGNLFKRKATKDVKTELVIFLTPYVVQRPTEIAKLTEDETRRTSFKEGTFTQEQVDRYFEQAPVKAALPEKSKKRPGKPRLPIVIPLK
jgi:type II secretion system protein D